MFDEKIPVSGPGNDSALSAVASGAEGRVAATRIVRPPEKSPGVPPIKSTSVGGTAPDGGAPAVPSSSISSEPGFAPVVSVPDGSGDDHASPGTPGWAAAVQVAADGTKEAWGTVVVGPVGPAPVPVSARELIAIRMALVLMTPADAEAEAIDRIRALEQLKAACAAAQVRETRRLDTLRLTDEAARGIPAERQGRGLAGEIGLARRVSPHRGSRLLQQARSLSEDLPHTLSALSDGSISEEHAGIVHRQTAWLPDRHARSAVDTALADGLPVLGAKQLAWAARALAVEQDPAAAAARFDTAVAERRVIIRATNHGMATLTATLPLIQAAACHRALTDTAASLVALGESGGRTAHQVMADTLVERLTSQATADQVPVKVHLVMTDTTLLGEDHTPARIPGHGSVPAPIARRLLTHTITGTRTGRGTGTGPGVGPGAGATSQAGEVGEAEVFLRRLYTAPDTGQLVAMDSRRRAFPALLRRMVILRDDLCRTPYCNAQIKHLDHATPHAAGGKTSWANASGLCARCNHAKENPGWRHPADPENLHVITPTGHRYHHPTPPLTTRPLTTPPLTTAQQRAGTSPLPGPRRFPNFTPLRFSLRQVRTLLDAA